MNDCVCVCVFYSLVNENRGIKSDKMIKTLTIRLDEIFYILAGLLIKLKDEEKNFKGGILRLNCGLFLPDKKEK